MTHSGGWLTISKVPPPQANTLLGASYQVYRHTETDPIILHTTSYALPTVLHEYGETVDDVLQFATHSFANLASGSERYDASVHNSADRLMLVV